MLDKILIIDFEDSFTYNIANVLYAHETSVQVLGHREFFSSLYFDELMKSSQKRALILGPGPGHPDEYIHYQEKIKLLMDKKNLFVMGICLGHQLMGKIAGRRVDYSRHQVHGQSELIEFKGRKIPVQRYNSLSVWEKEKEVDIQEFPRGVSYQFHPESIGTADNDIFFKDLLVFLE
ncbi:hypothetical protein C0V70_10560 [Bacteriovorax stolpii]|uniref:Glutamine amidotransferase domain-containing protein n=1 Tax=Bacteriovorax stolpii TaxID=960 RepID=A0A2K9NSR2_BACTC|nr:aminodeoxychorismate/anthranilate synthase component II [Bacteriovorax stolpii]AUN98538.1 hypothetical protein C0V70_10560 [Bacteriovorax stolpii]TDP50834.1 anthranilate synthase component II [Bacteriovorax stolpii]